MVDSVSGSSSSQDVSFDKFNGTFKTDYAGYGKSLAQLVNNKGDTLKANGIPITPAQLAKTEFGMDGQIRARAGGWDSPFHSGDSAAAASFVNNLNPDRLQQIAKDPQAARALSDSLSKVHVSIEGKGIRYTETSGEPSTEAQTALTKLKNAQQANALADRGADKMLGMSDACGFGGCVQPPPPMPSSGSANLDALYGRSPAR